MEPIVKKRKPTDYFYLKNLIEFKDISPIDFVNRDFSKVEVELHLPIGTTLIYKKGDATWILIDICDGWYMFGLANSNDDYKIYNKNNLGEFLGYTFQAFKIRIKEFNQIFGFDKKTGITPPNKIGVLSNINVISDGVNFCYKLTELPKFIVKNINPYFMKLLESILSCLTVSEPDVVLETKWDISENLEEDISIFYIKESIYPNETIDTVTINMWIGLIEYIPILKQTGEFFNKKVVEVKI